MLSRSAESLYWMSRYMERAEDITRLLGVNFNAMLEAQISEEQLGWRPLVQAFGDETLYISSCFGEEFSARSVTEYLLWHPDNPNAVVACIQRARENARSVREQVSTEMWEHLNRVYHHLRDLNQAEVLASPYSFFSFVRDASQAFQGISTATMMHGEPFEFIQLGKYIERGIQTVEILDMKYAGVSAQRSGSPEAIVQLIATLKSCSAFEPFRRAHAGQMQPWRVMEYLLLNREFPRAVIFCLDRCARSVAAISGSSSLPSTVPTGTVTPAARSQPGPFSGPHRLFGRLGADLEYLDIHEVLGDAFHPYLAQLLKRIYAAGDEVTRTYFNTQIILPDTYPQQQQQQQ